LQDADLVAERVAQAAVDPVAVVGRLLRELDALGAEPLVRAEAAVGAEGVSPNVTRKVRMKCASETQAIRASAATASGWA
jgi:hypothetical protein